MKLKLLFLFAFYILTLPTSAQNIPKLPSAPDIAVLNKFIDFPVNKSTGTVGITIPIYTIDVNGYSLPISLSYHTGGIKVSEVAGSLGLGWALSAGGQISRSINGKNDDGGYFTHGGFFRYS
ncbi:hypothetical protein AQ505_20250 [Pedobacter sp. PACM 27299]|uniref:hypothetical protein n=1 Tax=Pedobacter sp. PACM 27299 TaxID=1727164 RepID=UPI00070579BD|nr:hypothetical protein [Pedobacter sp. PACM 27299]ALL07615.1 hypothetical protein AQ505_20250 [Pedobacter sp. PACM 27299]